MGRSSQLFEHMAGNTPMGHGLFQQAPSEAPPQTAEVPGSGSGIAAGRFILRTVETVLEWSR